MSQHDRDSEPLQRELDFDPAIECSDPDCTDPAAGVWQLPSSGKMDAFSDVTYCGTCAPAGDPIIEVDQEAIRHLQTVVGDDIEIEQCGTRLRGPDGTTLVNLRNQTAESVTRIDRRSDWGNPFRLRKDGGSYDRLESVSLYRGWVLGQLERGVLDLETLRGETLGCWCLPKDCHGVVLLNLIVERTDGDGDE